MQLPVTERCNRQQIAPRDKIKQLNTYYANHINCSVGDNNRCGNALLSPWRPPLKSGSQGRGLEPNTDLIRTGKDHRNSKEQETNELNFAYHASSVVSVQLIFQYLPGMHCPLASGLGMNIFSASLLLTQVLVQFEFCNQMADPEGTP